jgi:hypothetical protein
MMSRTAFTDIVTLMVVGPLPLIALWSAIVSHRMVAKLESVWVRSKFVNENKGVMKGLGIAGKIMLCGSVCAILICPKSFVRDGSVLQEEVDAVPKEWKMTVYPPFIASGIWTVALFICGVFVW